MANRHADLADLLHVLRLPTIAEVFADWALRAAKDKLTHEAFRYQLGQAEQGRSVLFCSAYQMVQDLLAAKRDLRLPKVMDKLARFDALILDDIGYVQQNREEMEVLFTLLAERYERASVIITTNLVFSEWDRIFKDPMTTMAAIDRVVHHSVILDLMQVESYRAEAASKRRTGADNGQNMQPQAAE